jgi:uncharacterized membrane protein
MPISPLLPVHISAGVVGTLSGAAAMIFDKGSRRHIRSGKVFLIAMPTMSASGAIMAVIKHQAPNVLAGTLAFYMVATAWATARRGDGKTGAFDWGALLFALWVGAVELTFAFQAASSPTGRTDGYPAALYFIFASVILLAAAGDIRMLARGGVLAQSASPAISGACVFHSSSPPDLSSSDSSRSSPPQYAKPMCFFFPPLLPLLLLIFWLLRVWFTSTDRQSWSRRSPEFPSVVEGFGPAGHLRRRTP